MTNAPGSTRVDALRAEGAALEQAGDFAAALSRYEAALELAPLDGELLSDLADLAGRMGLHEAAMSLWGRLLEIEPDRVQAYDGFARSLRDQHRYDEAIAVLQQLIPAHPGDSRLWNTLGTVLNQAGRAADAAGFFQEAVRTDPSSAVARYNLGGVRFDQGDHAAAAEDFRAARSLARDPAHAAMIDLASALLHLARGELSEGWRKYAARNAPHYSGYVEFEAPGEEWTPGAVLRGRRLLVVAEQGLGDEVMFANLVPDVLDAVGRDGKVTIAVERRLQQLFQRSFPAARVLPHATDRSKGRPVRSVPGAEDIDLWAPMASLAAEFRPDLAAFPATPAYLAPDPDRIAHWRRWLGEGLAVGLSWRSGDASGERRRLYPNINALEPLLRIPNARLVNLQYGAQPAELDGLAQIAGRPIEQPPGLDIRNDLDDLAALSVALSAVVSVSNATAQIAAACGAPIGIVSGPAPWSKLGTQGYPWYPQALALEARTPGDWAEPIARAAHWLRSL